MKMRLVMIVLVVVCFLVAPVPYSAGLSETVSENDSNCDWPCWGGNPAHTFSVADECAPDVERMKLLWDYDSEVGIRRYNISNNQLFLCTINGIQCLDVDSGSVIWEKKDLRYMSLSLKNGMCIGLYCIWSEDDVEYTFSLSCLDQKTGNELWNTELGSGYMLHNSTLFINDDYIAIHNRYFRGYGDTDWKLKFYSLHTGELKNSIVMDSYSNYGVFHDGSYICTQSIDDDSPSAGSTIKSFSNNNLETEWEYVLEKDTNTFSYSPMIHSDKIYVCSYVKNDEDEETISKMNCFNTKNGELEWDIDLPFVISDLLSISNGRMYILADEQLLCYSIDSKKMLWKVDNNGTFWNIVVCDGLLFASNVYTTNDKQEHYILCLNAENGKEIWRSSGIEYTVDVIEVAGNKLFVSASKDKKEDSGIIYCWGTPKPKGAINRIEVSPTSILINHNETYQFKATVFDSSDNELPEKITWSVDPKSAGTITQDGFFTPGKRADKCVVKAESGGKVAFALVTIVQAVRIKIEPSYIDIRPGEKVEFLASVLDSKGKGIIGVPKMWSLSDPKLGEISPLGEFTAGETGGISGNVFCTFGNIKGKAKINIINVNMENAVSFERGTVNFGEIVSGHEKTLEIILKNNVGVPITVDIAKFGSWFEISKDKLTIPANSEKMIELTLTNTNLKPGMLYIGKIRANWDDGVAYSQVTVRVMDE